MKNKLDNSCTCTGAKFSVPLGGQVPFILTVVH